MDIREYLFRHKIRQRDFARLVGISEPALNSYIFRRSSPGLERALHLNKMTNGEVQIEDMIALTEAGEPKYTYKKARPWSMFPKKPLKYKEDEL